MSSILAHLFHQEVRGKKAASPGVMCNAALARMAHTSKSDSLIFFFYDRSNFVK